MLVIMYYGYNYSDATWCFGKFKFTYVAITLYIMGFVFLGNNSLRKPLDYRNYWGNEAKRTMIGLFL